MAPIGLSTCGGDDVSLGRFGGGPYGWNDMGLKTVLTRLGHSLPTVVSCLMLLAACTTLRSVTRRNHHERPSGRRT
jgi:hypothetical protein